MVFTCWQHGLWNSWRTTYGCEGRATLLQLLSVETCWTTHQLMGGVSRVDIVGFPSVIDHAERGCSVRAGPLLLLVVVVL